MLTADGLVGNFSIAPILPILDKTEGLVLVECLLEVVDLTTATTHIGIRIGKIDGGTGVGVLTAAYAPVVDIYRSRGVGWCIQPPVANLWTVGRSI